MSSYPARYLPYRRYPPRSQSFCQLPAEVERSLSAGSSRPADRAISGDCPHRSALTSSPKDDGEASDNAMDTTPIHNDARPVVYIYAQDWRQYVGRQMEVRVAQSLGDEIEVRVNRAVASALAGLRTTPDSHKGAHHQKYRINDIWLWSTRHVRGRSPEDENCDAWINDWKRRNADIPIDYYIGGYYYLGLSYYLSYYGRIRHGKRKGAKSAKWPAL
ncbi:hypothetical protein HD554DRAFT_2041179 [Boletus coccyginus]|nr:hypothetical protein HD554DRAFT_2041179 [Boletus coccyginus]